MARKRLDISHVVFSVLGAVILLFIIAPMISLFLKTKIPAFAETIADQDVRHSIGITLACSAGAVLFFSVFAIPFAWLMARKQFPGKTIIRALTDLPVVIPHTAAGIALLGFISRDTALGQAADSLGFSLVGHPVGIALAMAFVSLPFLLNAARDAFESVPRHLELTALNLGASPWRTFVSVSLPMAWHGILTGFVMMFARGMSEFGAVVIIAYHPMTAPVMIFERFTSFGLDYARPVAAFFIIIALIVFYLLRFLARKRYAKSRFAT
jgi:molybdate/tungstate transport system permease protein